MIFPNYCDNCEKVARPERLHIPKSVFVDKADQPVQLQKRILERRRCQQDLGDVVKSAQWEYVR